MKAKRAFAESAAESSQKRFPEAMAEEAHRQKEGGLSAADPARAIERDSTAGHDAMQVRMQMQILSPGMQHREEADVGAEQSGVGGGFKQRGGGRAEQDGVDQLRVLKCQAADLRRQREHDVEVGHGQKLGFALCEPAGASLGLALGAMPIPARVI